MLLLWNQMLGSKKMFPWYCGDVGASLRGCRLYGSFLKSTMYTERYWNLYKQFLIIQHFWTWFLFLMTKSINFDWDQGMKRVVVNFELLLLHHSSGRYYSLFHTMFDFLSNLDYISQIWQVLLRCYLTPRQWVFAQFT